MTLQPLKFDLNFIFDFSIPGTSSGSIWTLDVNDRWTAHWHGPPALCWLSSYVASHRLAMAPQSSAKDKSYSYVYNITLNLNLNLQSLERI